MSLWWILVAFRKQFFAVGLGRTVIASHSLGRAIPPGFCSVHSTACCHGILSHGFSSMCSHDLLCSLVSRTAQRELCTLGCISSAKIVCHAFVHTYMHIYIHMIEWIISYFWQSCVKRTPVEVELKICSSQHKIWCVYGQVHIYIRAYMHAYIHTCMHTHTYINLCVSVTVCAHVCVCSLYRVCITWKLPRCVCMDVYGCRCVLVCVRFCFLQVYSL